MTIFFFFFFNDTAPTEIYTLSLHDALPISLRATLEPPRPGRVDEHAVPEPRAELRHVPILERSEEHTSELQSQSNLVCRLLLEKKKQRQDALKLSRRRERTCPVHRHRPTAA